MKKLFVGLIVIMSLVGCNKESVTDEVIPPTPTAKFSDTTYAIDFTYPASWVFNQSDTEGILQVQASNIEAPDGYDCDEDYAGVIITSTVRDTTDDFDTWIEKNHSIDPGLGQYGGEITKLTGTVFGDYPAYRVEKMGWDTYCPAYGYVIDYSDEENQGRIVEVIISRNEDYAEGVAETNQVLNNIVLTK